MKKLFYFLLVVAIFSCNKEVEKVVTQKPPADKELINEAKDREVAARKGGNSNWNGHNPNNNPTDPPPPPPPPDTTKKKAVILLDFDGHHVTGIWGIFDVEASLLDAKGQAEALAVARADYSFNDSILITTNEDVYFTYPANKRTRVVITKTNFYGNVGGVAYRNSMSWGDETCCFVFSSLLGNANNTGKAASHEAGHTLGCPHFVQTDDNCIYLGEYMPGYIMGYGYGFSVWGTPDKCHSNNDIETINNSVNL